MQDLNETERIAWLSFKRNCKDFLGNHKAPNYHGVVQDLLTSYKAMGCNMSLKIHFLESHLNFFSRKSRRSQWRTRWKISPRHYVYGKAVPRQVDLKYVGDWRVLYLTQNTDESHTPLHFRGKFLSVSWARKVLFCTFKFLCIFETLFDRNILYTYLNSAQNVLLSFSIEVCGTKNLDFVDQEKGGELDG